MSFQERLKSIVAKHEQIGEKLAVADGRDIAKLSKEYADLTDVVKQIKSLWKAETDKQEYEAISMEAGGDAELKAMAKEELPSIKEKIEQLEKQVQVALLPKDEADDLSVILEIRAGTGGDEAALFAANLFRMYQRYAEIRKFSCEILEINDTGIGGYKEVIASIKGHGVYARLKFESGVHRVQRVPETEASGRIHTSAATVAILPEAEEVNVHIEEKDLRIDVYRASGAGGQHVNKTESAVRITHLPTGIMVAQQDDKSQHRNKDKAMRILKARLYDHQRQEIDKKRSADRKHQVGSGDRSERIRTYNFPQGRVTDHRINVTLYKLDKFLEGDLDEMIDALRAEDQARQLAGGIE